MNETKSTIDNFKLSCLSADIKLVIWDLDDTFWKGTLEESEIVPVLENIELVKTLTDRGIINSIVSKNSKDKALAMLEKLGVRDFFVFPVINYNPKGENVKTLLTNMGLRPQNVLFIDDNVQNLNEVKYYNLEINCLLPYSCMACDLLNNRFLHGKDDKAHSRLNQYLDLEKRVHGKQVASSNEEFLYESNIRVEILRDCANYIDRIHELILRTNQLNYTKKRIEKEELIGILEDKKFECACVRVFDNYGDYGIVGFYALKDRVLEHFLFSCRALGIGIENYIYNYLDCPNVEIQGEVVSTLENKNTPWLSMIDSNSTCLYDSNMINTKIPKDKILLVGGCDLEQTCKYLESVFEIQKEFATVIDGKIIKTSDTNLLINSFILSSETKEELYKELPWFDSHISFKTHMFDGNCKVVVLSVVDDYVRDTYKRNGENWYIGYGAYWEYPEEIEKLNSTQKAYLEDNFTRIGKESLSLFKENLIEIIKKVQKSGAMLVLINGIEIDVSDWIGEDRCARNKEMNSVIDEIIATHKDVHLLDMRNIVLSRRQLVLRDNRHYDRKTYYSMAQELIAILQSAGTNTWSKGYYSVYLRDVFKRVIDKLNGIIRGQ